MNQASAPGRRPTIGYATAPYTIAGIDRSGIKSHTIFET